MTAGRPGDEYDPLTDPTPPDRRWPEPAPQDEQESAPWFTQGQGDPQPWSGAQTNPQAYSRGRGAQQQPYAQGGDPQPYTPSQGAPGAYDGPRQPQEYGRYAPDEYPSDAAQTYAETYAQDWYGQPEPEPIPVPEPRPAPRSFPAQADGTLPAPDDETVALRTSDTRRASETPLGPGRAERRRAAKGRGRRRPESATASAAPSRPLSRVEARRAARAAKDSPAVIASRAIGELFISFGVLMLLFVTYQLWWTNIRAGQEAGRETNKIQDSFAQERKPGAFEPGQGFAIMYIPKLDVVVPIAEGISKPRVLDRGMVGHYGEGKLKTAMPADKAGNFAVAGHRNTHGEPFRYINRLKPGDPIVVETREAYYTYEMANILPQTSPSNIDVIGPVPPGSGFGGPGRYITLTTCTPEFTSTYRMIVWGKMVEERPRSKGKPDALVG